MSERSEESIGRRISTLYRYFQMYISKEMEEYNIGSTEYLFLISIPFDDKVNQKELCDKLLVHKTLGTRALRMLEEKGYITRTKGKDDSREKNVQLTDKGVKTVPVVVPKLQNWTAILSKGMDESEIAAVIDNLDKMCNNAMGHVKNERS